MIDALTLYFRGESAFAQLGLPAVEADYKWRIPTTLYDGSTPDYPGTNFKANVALKKDLSRRWAQEPKNRERIAKWIISDWGGIRGNKKTTIHNYYLEALKNTPQTPIKGIASFSKILAIKAPDQYAIYDARVAVSLNAIQIIAGKKNGLAFPYLSGRNNITGNWTAKPKRGFSANAEASIDTLTSKPNEWTRVKNDAAYVTYLGGLHQISTELNVPVYFLEMALFAQAEKLACKVFPALEN